MRAHRRKLAADLKNAQRKKQRLQKRARMLSTEELLTVVAWRESATYDAATLFGGGRPSTEEATEEAAGSGEEEELADESAGEEARDPGAGEVITAPSAGTV